MTAVESAQEIGAAPATSAGAPVATVRDRLADLWPLTMIALGLVLSMIWTVGLLGLFVVLLI